MEWDLLDTAVKRKIPVLGICRGEQLINVYFGGTLHQSIAGFYLEKPNLRTVRAKKWVKITPGTLLERVLRSDCLRVNSLHKQSIHRLGEGLQIAAQENNGVVQAIEHIDFDFLLGVQWHPEFLPLHRQQRRLFHKFVDAALGINSTVTETQPIPLAATTRT
jgi:putative glutamine amidotransferase